MDPLVKLDETRAALRVLLFIYEHEGCNITRIIYETPLAGQKAVYTAIRTLLELSLVDEKFEVKKGTMKGERKFYLTDKGRKVAELLKAVKDILSA